MVVNIKEEGEVLTKTNEMEPVASGNLFIISESTVREIKAKHEEIKFSERY